MSTFVVMKSQSASRPAAQTTREAYQLRRLRQKRALFRALLARPHMASHRRALSCVVGNLDDEIQMSARVDS